MNREHSPVIGLAILKVNSDHGKDHIDSFVPFVADVLRRSDTDVVSVPDLQEGIERGFGLRIPRGALRSMLHRCKQEGLISFRDRIFYRVPEKLASVDLGPRRSAAVETYGLILKELSGFASDRYGKEWDLQVAEAALLDYLNEKSVEALSGIVGDRVVPLPSQDVPDAIFIVNSFAAAAFVERRAVFDCLKVVVKGRMLADVLYYPALEAIDRRFRNTEVFLDTGLILRMLKLAHEDLSIPALELQELLVQQGARLACFEHTYQEIHEVLQRCSDQLRQGSKRADCGETLQFFVDEGYRPSDVELLIEKLPTLFVAAGIRVVRPPRISSGLFLDEPKLEAALQAAVGYRSRRVLLRDLDSIVGVYRAARGVLKCHLENRKALFVTTNVRVASASARYFADDFRGSVTPFCLPAYVLTTLIWLKVPTRSPDLEERQILADAYAAMNPSGALWEKYIEEVERLRERGKVSEEDYYLMRFSSAAKRELVEMTHGSALAYVDGSSADVLARAVENIKRDGTQQAMKLKSQVESLKAAELLRISQLQRIANALARFARQVMQLAIVGGLAFCVYVTLPDPVAKPQVEWVYPAAMGLLGAITVLSFLRDWKISAWTRKVEDGIKHLVLRVLKRLLRFD